MDLSERFASPVCHAGDYNLERIHAVYNPQSYHLRLI
jgi:hypothetical protein